MVAQPKKEGRMRDTKIQWADDTVSFWWGCTQVGPGCDNCYAKDIAERFKVVPWNGPVTRKPSAFAEIARIGRQARKEGRKRWVFVNSMSDFFDKAAPDVWRKEALNAIEEWEDHLVVLLLTKRVGNVADMLEKIGRDRLPANVALGITVVNQVEAERDIPKLMMFAFDQGLHGLRRTFLSIEPMLGPMSIRPYLSRISWVICGGESGRDARPMHPDWTRSLRDQCAEASVPFFFKQWGEYVPGGHPAALALGDFTMRDAMALSTKGGQFADGQSCWRVGKKAAGRLLDGAEHDGRPNW